MSTKEETSSREFILKERWYTERNNKEFNISLVRGKNKHWWICKLKHYWFATGQRITETNGCPYCANRLIWEGFNDVASTHPHLLEQWNFEKSEYSPKEIFAGTRKDIHWSCSSCLGDWVATLYSRAQGNGCPYCSNQKILKGFNDLKTRCPKIASDWDYSLNLVNPDEIIYGSHTKVNWRCSKNHAWKTSVKHRVNGTGCPQCAKESKSSIEEKELFSFVEDALEGKYAVISSDREILKGWELDVYVPELKRGLEFNGIFWHSDGFLQKKMGISAKDYHQGKLDRAKESGVDVAFIWQDDWRNNLKEIKKDIKEFLKSGKKSDMLTRLE